MRKTRPIAALTAALLLAGLTGAGLSAGAAAHAAAAQSAAAESLADLAARLEPSVVNVQVEKQGPALMGFEGMPGVPGMPGMPDMRPGPHRMPVPPPGPMRRMQGVGSGFVLSEDGYIVTNNHVVDDARAVKVTFATGDEYEAKVVGRDPKTDLALVKIEPKGKLPAVKLGNSDALRVGDPVFAIGNPFGLEGTVTSGIVSAKGRVIGAGPYDDFLQTDAAINPGNSGGPLFNLKGEVVGINTAIVGGGQGLGFAIPVNLAKTILPQLRAEGRVTRGWLGVTIQAVTDALARSLELGEAKGALVSQVTPGSPADKAGIKPGDVIVTFDGRPVEKTAGLPTLVSGVKPGTSARVEIVRDGQRQALTVNVGQMPDEEVAAATGETTEPNTPRVGLALAPVPAPYAQRLRLEAGRGALVTAVQPDSPAARAGLRPGDVLVEVNRKPIAGADEAVAAIQSAPAGQSILVRVAREDGYVFAAIEPRKG